MKKTIILCTALLILLGGSGFAADYTKTGSVGAQFLKIAVGSRYQGMGEASVAMVNDAYSLYWNPAGLANIEGTSITFTNVNWVTDVKLNYVALGTQVEDFGTIGFSAALMSMGDMEVTTGRHRRNVYLIQFCPDGRIRPIPDYPLGFRDVDQICL